MAGECKSVELALKGKSAMGTKREHLLKKKKALEACLAEMEE